MLCKKTFYIKLENQLHIIVSSAVKNALTGFTAENIPIAKRVICIPLRIKVSNAVRCRLIQFLQYSDFPFRKISFRSGQVQVLDIR
jgi:hypothetical protein